MTPHERLDALESELASIRTVVDESVATLRSVMERADRADERDGEIASVVTALDDAVHKSYAGGAGVGPRVLQVEAVQGAQARAETTRGEGKSAWQALYEWPVARLMEAARFLHLDQKPWLLIVLLLLGLFSYAVRTVYNDQDVRAVVLKPRPVATQDTTRTPTE